MRLKPECVPDEQAGAMCRTIRSRECVAGVAKVGVDRVIPSFGEPLRCARSSRARPSLPPCEGGAGGVGPRPREIVAAQSPQGTTEPPNKVTGCAGSTPGSPSAGGERRNRIGRCAAVQDQCFTTPASHSHFRSRVFGPFMFSILLGAGLSLGISGCASPEDGRPRGGGQARTAATIARSRSTHRASSTGRSRCKAAPLAWESRREPRPALETRAGSAAGRRG